MLQEEEKTKRETPASFAERGQAHGAAVVDVVGQLRIQVAQRVVRERRQVDDGVEALEVSSSRRRGCPSGSRDLREALAERAGLVEVAVEPDDLVARLARASGP